MAKINNHLVIMAGGVGSRFWPMSTADKPKQFIDVLGIGKSLLQLTVDRFDGIVPSENVWVVTNQKYADTVSYQLPDMPVDHILCEPCRRNTAPCIAYVSWRIKSKDPKANIVVSPSDHIVMNPTEFRRVISECLKFTSDTDAIVTLGMKPTRPETGYGYIQADLSSKSLRNKEIFRVDSFREKPDLETAKQYISEKNYYWNAGIFIWTPNNISVRRTIIGMLVFSFGTCPPLSMLSASISLQWPRFLNHCFLFMALHRSNRRLTVCSPNARTSLSTMPSWRRRRKFSYVQLISDGVTSAHGVPCFSKARKTFTAMLLSGPILPCSRVTTASSTQLRKRRLSFRDLMVIS